MKLNLGCGEDIKKGYINMDAVALPGVDTVHDIDCAPWPFEDNSFNEIYCSHVLEHVSDLAGTMSEIRRVALPGACILIRAPHFSCGVSYRDPTHRRLFSYFTFDYFTSDCFYELPKFEIIKRQLNFTRLSATFLNPIINPLLNISPHLYERLFCWILPASEVVCELKVIKD